MTDPVPRKTHDRPFHTIHQVADRWQCSDKSVRRLITSGKLVAHRFGKLFRISDPDLTTYERVNRHGY